MCGLPDFQGAHLASDGVEGLPPSTRGVDQVMVMKIGREVGIMLGYRKSGGSVIWSLRSWPGLWWNIFHQRYGPGMMTGWGGLGFMLGRQGGIGQVGLLM